MYVVERRLEVDVDYRVPLCLVHTQHKSVAGDTGVVDEYVDTAEVLHYLVHRRLCIGEISGIGGIGTGLDAGSLEFLESILVYLHVRECYVRTLGCELQGNRLADSPGCARNQGDFSV